MVLFGAIFSCFLFNSFELKEMLLFHKTWSRFLFPQHLEAYLMLGLWWTCVRYHNFFLMPETEESISEIYSQRERNAWQRQIRRQKFTAREGQNQLRRRWDKFLSDRNTLYWLTNQITDGLQSMNIENTVRQMTLMTRSRYWRLNRALVLLSTH